MGTLIADPIDDPHAIDDYVVGRRQPRLRLPVWRGKAPSVTDPLQLTPWLYFGHKGLKRPLKDYLGRGPAEISPGVLSVDPRKLAFVREFADQIAKEDPAQLTPSGFATERGVIGDLRPLDACSGVKMEPANTPTIDVDSVLRTRGLSTSWAKPQHKLIYRLLHRMMFGKHKRGTGYHIARDSSTSNPFFVYSMYSKQQTAQGVLRSFGDILAGVEKGDWVGLANRREKILFMHHTVERAQAESSDKERKVQVLTNEHDPPDKWKWEQRIADKRGPLRRFGVTDPRFGAMRIRTAYGSPFATNVGLACVLAGIRAAYYDAYGYTFHHTTRQDKYAKLADAGWDNVVAVDVEQMDQTFPPFLLDAFADWMGDYMDPRIGLMMRRLIHAPYFRPPVTFGGTGLLVGNPFALSDRIQLGLPSGIACNPECGKFGVTGALLCMLHDHFGILSGDERAVEVELDRLLKGQHEMFSIQDSADDAVIATRTAELRARLEAILNAPGASPYFGLAIEKGGKFLGDLLRADAAGKLLMPVPDIRTFFINRLSAEHGIRHAFRIHWAWGALAAMEHYRQAGPVFNDWFRVFEDLWRLHFGDIPHLFQAARMATRLLDPPGWDTADPKTLAVLFEPSRLFHRYLPSEIDPTLLATLTAEIPGTLIDETLGSFLPPPY